MLKNLFSNPVTRTFIAMLIAMLGVLGAFFTYVTAPAVFGNANVRFDIEQICYLADDWSVAYDYATIAFSPGTLVIPGYHRGRVVAVLLIPPETSPGEVSFSFPKEFRGTLPEKITDKLSQALILLDYADYARMLQDSGNTILLRADDITAADVPRQYLKLQMDQGYNLMTNYDVFGFTNWLLPTPQTVLLRLWGQEQDLVTYYEDARVEVTAPDFSLSFDHPQIEKQFYPPPGYQGRALLYMVFLALTAGGLIAFIGGGLEFKEREVEGQYNLPRTVLTLLGAMLCAGTLSAVATVYQPSPYLLAFLWVLPLLGVLFWARKARLEPSFFGLSSAGLTAGLIATIGVCAFISLGSTFSLLTGLKLNAALLPLGATIIFREALLRGFCQRIISHWLHPVAGLLIVSTLWTLVSVFTGPLPVGALTLASTLGRSLVVGYLFFCSKNLYATCLLGALLELAPFAIRL